MNRLRWMGAALALLASAGGCGDGLPPAADPGQAREVLVAALDAWKDGRTPDDLQARTPPVRVIDRDWSGGARITGYTIDGDGQPLGLGLQCPVSLTLKDARGKAATKRVVYVVNTGKAPVVARQDADF